MKKLLVVIMLSSMSGCASAELDEYDNAVALENRKLWISSTVAGFEYPYWVCVKPRKIFGGCAQKELKVDYYDLTNPEVREKLKNMGFIGVVRDKRLP